MADPMKRRRRPEASRLTIVAPAGNDKWRAALVECQCTCGNKIILRRARVTSGYTKSCGCLQKERVSEVKHRHGHDKRMSRTREYSTWLSMKDRCQNEKHKSFKHYGGRGIAVCDRWSDSFINFLNDMGPKPVGLTLERIDVDGGYDPDNCKWATYTEQRHNRRKKPSKTNYTRKNKPVILLDSDSRWKNFGRNGKQGTSEEATD